MTSKKFIFSILKWSLVGVLSVLCAIMVVDPYGINPWGIKIPRINEIKYERTNIDRLIKPWEVYWKQPKTIFIGTSRPHQSLNPEVLKGTIFAPAYNAAVPDSYMSDHLSFIEEYIKSNPNLKYIVLDIFWRYFVLHSKSIEIIQQAETQRLLPVAYCGRYIRLIEALGKYLSIESLLDSTFTIKKNLFLDQSDHYITSAGYLYLKVGDSSGQFPDYGKNMLQAGAGEFIKIHLRFFDLLSNLYAMCQERGITLILTLLPEYPISDHFYMETGQFTLLEYFLKRLSHYPNVYYFSSLGKIGQNPNPYWWDPHHPSIIVGNMVLECLKTGKPNPNIPDFGVLLTPRNVNKIIADRKEGLKKWMALNRPYVKSFKELQKSYTPIKVISPPDLN